MARGQKASVGDVRTAPNGYHYTRTEECWRLTHHIIAEEKLGRALYDDERVSFMDNDRTNLDPANLLIRRAGHSSLDSQIARLNERIRELTAQRDILIERKKEKNTLLAQAEVSMDSN